MGVVERGCYIVRSITPVSLSISFPLGFVRMAYRIRAVIRAMVGTGRSLALCAAIARAGGATHQLSPDLEKSWKPRFYKSFWTEGCSTWEKIVNGSGMSNQPQRISPRSFWKTVMT